MNERLARLRTRTRDREFSHFRHAELPDVWRECDAESLFWQARRARLTRRMCESERVVIDPDERIVFTRTLTGIPKIYRDEELAVLTDGATLHEGGVINNVCADWGLALNDGLAGRRRVALATRKRAVASGNGASIEFLDAAVETIDAVLALASRYSAAAEIHRTR